MKNEWLKQYRWALWCLWAGLTLSSLFYACVWWDYAEHDGLFNKTMKMPESSSNSSLLTLLTSTKETSTTTQESTTSSTAGTTSSTIETTPRPTPTIPPQATASGGFYFSTKPDSIDFRWQTCNPFENVTWQNTGRLQQIDNITNCSSFSYTNEWNETSLLENCSTYYFESLDCRQVVNSSKLLNCTETFSGTSDIVSYLVKNETKTWKGGCMIIPTSCCTCLEGSHIDAINAKLYGGPDGYYSKVLKNCTGAPIVCPMSVRSPIGCTASTECLWGRCQIVGR